MGLLRRSEAESPESISPGDAHRISELHKAFHSFIMSALRQDGGTQLGRYMRKLTEKFLADVSEDQLRTLLTDIHSQLSQVLYGQVSVIDAPILTLPDQSEMTEDDDGQPEGLPAIASGQTGAPGVW